MINDAYVIYFEIFIFIPEYGAILIWYECFVYAFSHQPKSLGNFRCVSSQNIAAPNGIAASLKS